MSNIWGIKKHIQETKRDLNNKKNWAIQGKLKKRLKILQRVLKSKRDKIKRAKLKK
jgi:hypothetical protein